MSDNYFEENRKFLGLKGVIGRRDFIVNYFIIELIDVLLWSIPLGIAVFFKPGFLSRLLDSALSAPASQPFIIVLGMAILGLFIVPLYFSSIVRRVRDILGEEDDNRVYLLSSVLAVICYISYTPVGYLFMGKWLVIFVFLCMMCWEGKITSKKPKSDIIKFNWGAFWGTWMWGLINKVPVTLFAIPLVFTLGILPFMIICGLKGNEWAYEKDKEREVETFHKTQSTQATIFSVAAPFIIIGCTFFTFLTVTAGVAGYVKASPEFSKKFDTFVRTNEEAIVKSTFPKIELTKDEYKFFVSPVTWNEESRFTRASAFKTAVNYVILQQEEDTQTDKLQEPSDKSKSEDKFNKDKILKYIQVSNKTKIYSSFNNEILAEYYIEPSKYESLLKNLKTKSDLKNLYKVLETGYKFNDHPSIP